MTKIMLSVIPVNPSITVHKLAETNCPSTMPRKKGRRVLNSPGPPYRNTITLTSQARKILNQVHGLAIGCSVAIVTSRMLSSVLFGIDPIDPLTFGVVPVVVLGVAAAASYLPARRAARVDPLTALRSE